jgi:hypothetical protein
MKPGLPDGIFFKPKIPIWQSFGGPWNGKGWYILRPVGIYYVHLVHFIAIWKFSGNLVYFTSFWYFVSRKIWQPCTKLVTRKLSISSRLFNYVLPIESRVDISFGENNAQKFAQKFAQIRLKICLKNRQKFCPLISTKIRKKIRPTTVVPK